MIQGRGYASGQFLVGGLVNAIISSPAITQFSSLAGGSSSYIRLADRKERVKAMQDLYDKIPHVRTKLKLKILARIREEVGQDQPIQHVHAVHMGVNIPPRAETYDEWLKQNRLPESL